MIAAEEMGLGEHILADHRFEEEFEKNCILLIKIKKINNYDGEKND